MATEDFVVDRMRALIEQWEERADPKAVFLSCYWMMTSNMLAAIEQKEFNDPASPASSSAAPAGRSASAFPCPPWA